MLYNKYLSKMSFRRIFALSQAVVFLSNLMDLFWVSRANVALGISDEFFLLGADVVKPVVSQMNSMPMYVLAAKLCPKNAT